MVSQKILTPPTKSQSLRLHFFGPQDLNPAFPAHSWLLKTRFLFYGRYKVQRNKTRRKTRFASDGGANLVVPERKRKQKKTAFPIRRVYSCVSPSVSASTGKDSRVSLLEGVSKGAAGFVRFNSGCLTLGGLNSAIYPAEAQLR